MDGTSGFVCFLTTRVRWPGTWIDGLTDDEACEAQLLLRLMQGCLDEAAVALHLYQEARQAAGSEPPGHEVSEAEQAGCAAVEQEEMWTSRPPLTVGGNGWWEAEEEVRAQVEQDTNRRAWQSGRWPKSCKDLLPFLYARSFLYELDGISKALGVLAKQTWAPPGIAAAQVAWTTALPHLHEVRNSSHHNYEDGVPSVGPCGEPMDLNLAEKDFIRAPGSGVMALIALLGDRYGSAVADGHYGDVEVNEVSLSTAADILQQVIDTFQWHGPVQLQPGR